MKTERSILSNHIRKMHVARTKLQEARVPQVGIFWVRKDGSLLTYKYPWTESEELVGDWVNYSDHYKFWNHYSKLFGGVSGDYTSLPRGRVVFNKKTKEAKIIAGKKLLAKKSLISKIASEFKLNNYKADYDEHYDDAIQIDNGEYEDYTEEI